MSNNQNLSKMTHDFAQQLLEEKSLHEYDYTSGNPALYVGTYGKYNDGNLGGMWVDMTTFSDDDEFFDFCRLLHHDEEDPEFMFQDYENMPYNLYNESANPEEIYDIIEFSKLSADNREVFEAYIDCFGWSKGLEWRDVEYRYMGKWDSEEDYAEHYVDEVYCDEMSELMRRYFDYTAFARDLFMDGYYFENGHVFNNG